MKGVFVGIFEGHYDPAAAVVRDGALLAFAEEERFLRNKHAKGWYPTRALEFCLETAGVAPSDVSAIGLNWDVPSYSNGQMAAFFQQMRKEWPVDARTVSWQDSLLHIFSESAVRHRHALAWRRAFGNVALPKLHAVPHHYVHALHAFLQSPFGDALCLTVDGSGDKSCTVLWECRGDQIRPIYDIPMPHSLGWFYAAFTEYLGFEAYDGEYKVMGLAAYGRPDPAIRSKVDTILSRAEDGIGYRIDPRFIHYGTHNWSDRFTDLLPDLFQRLPRAPEEPIDDWHYNVAFAVQEALEESTSRLVRWGLQRAKTENLCISGGVGLNVKMNSKLFEVDGVARIFPHPLCSDSGAAAGAALGACWQLTGRRPELLRTLALGPDESDDEIKRTLDGCGLRYEQPADITQEVASALARGNVVGWFQGRMEAGPRALGHRSILADPRDVAARDRVNAVIKYREPWRPFCPSLKAEAAGRYLERWQDAPFMIIAFKANDKFKQDAPAVVHIDGTVRVQLVHSDVNPLFHRLLGAFEEITGIPVLLNTSFNVKGEPIVCTARDAIRTFYSTGMDLLAIGGYLIRKR